MIDNQELLDSYNFYPLTSEKKVAYVFPYFKIFWTDKAITTGVRTILNLWELYLICADIADTTL